MGREMVQELDSLTIPSDNASIAIAITSSLHEQELRSHDVAPANAGYRVELNRAPSSKMPCFHTLNPFQNPLNAFPYATDAKARPFLKCHAPANCFLSKISSHVFIHVTDA
jgi:hypothetical protein